MKILLLKDVVSIAKQGLIAYIDWDKYDISPEIIQANCSVGEGDFVRLSPCFKDPYLGQTINQLTSRVGFNCVIKSLDWETGRVDLDVNRAYPGYYILPSSENNYSGKVFESATLDESPSDFVARKVDQHLRKHENHLINDWLDPVNPQIPPLEVLPTEEMQVIFVYLITLQIKGYPLHSQQQKAIAQG